MSLLMRALERATRNGNDTPTAPSDSGASAAHRDLELEPFLPAQGTVDTTSQEVTAARSKWDANVAQRPADAAVAKRSYPRPVMIFIGLAVLFGAGYAYYVYRQLNGLNAVPPIGTTKSSAPRANPATSPEPIAQGARTAGTLPTAAVIERAAAPASSPTRSEEIVAPARTAKSEQVAAAASTKKAEPRESPAAASEALKPAAPAPVPQVSPAPQQTITVKPTSAQPVPVNPLLAEAYAALQAGRYDDARALYAQLAHTEPRNIDMLLGLAAIAVHQDKGDEAVTLYLRILELDPRNALAQAGVLAIAGQQDAFAAESRLKRLLEREPSAFLYFTLGNLYAGRSQWPSAQQAYFRAYHLDPGNSDYAYNLAIGLDHVAQHRIALGFYRRAIELARQTGRANFSVQQAEERVNELAAQAQ